MSTTMEQVFARKRSERAPRKLPKQERSRKTVEAILQAASQEFVRTGYNAATTNSIAEAAGVSIGSLYEYFPSKASILTALVDTLLDLSVSDLRARLASDAGQRLEGIASAIAASAAGVYQQNTRLNRILLAGAPRVVNWKRFEEISAMRIAIISEALAPCFTRTSALQHCAFTADCVAQSISQRAVLFGGPNEEFDVEAQIFRALVSHIVEAVKGTRRA